jgi:threonine/homoserine/homoserine lactone efflux protein
MGGKLPLAGQVGTQTGDWSFGAGMTRNVLSCSTIVVPIVIASALFIGAIIAQSFWLSLALGVAGVATFTYAVFVLREGRKSLPDARKLKSRRRAER